MTARRRRCAGYRRRSELRRARSWPKRAFAKARSMNSSPPMSCGRQSAPEPRCNPDKRTGKFMNRIDDETRMVVETVRRFVTEKVQPLEVETEETGVIPADRLAALKKEAIELGLYALNMPEEVGGGGLSTFAMCLVEEQLG